MAGMLSVTGQRETREIVKDLFHRRPEIYWPDMLLSACTGWTLFALAYVESSLLWTMVWASAASIALLRGILFVHEISHMDRRELPGFTPAWNLLVGFPLCAPSTVYEGVHTDHHRKTIYGTAKDPEYVPLAVGPRWKIFLFVFETMSAPFLFFTRFVILSPIGWIFPRFHLLLRRYASSLVVNPKFVRTDMDGPAVARQKRLELGVVLLWWSLLALMAIGVLRWKFLAVWGWTTFFLAFVNQIRTLGAHRYRNAGGEMDVVGQLHDSVNIVPGNIVTELWAPVGLRYHALHHYLPDMPYHSMPEAHRRLLTALPAEAPYHAVNNPNLLSVVKTLWQDSTRSQKEARHAACQSR